MSEAGDDRITVPQAARLLGLQIHTLYSLIDRGDLEAEVTVPPGPKRRRSVRLRRRDVEDYIGRSRITPGDLAHLYPEMPGDRYR